MEATAPAPAPREPRAPTSSPQTSAPAAELQPFSRTRRPARSRSRPRPCARVSPNTAAGKTLFLTQHHQFGKREYYLNIHAGTEAFIELINSPVLLLLFLFLQMCHQMSATAAVHSKPNKLPHRGPAVPSLPRP